MLYLEKEATKEVNALMRYIEKVPTDRLISRKKNNSSYFTKWKSQNNSFEKHKGIASIIVPLLKSDDAKIQEWLDADYHNGNL